MSNWKYGYNVDLGSVSREKFIADAINSGSNVHLIMTSPQNGIPGQGDLDNLWYIYNKLVVHYPELMLVWRFYSTREGEWSTFPDSKIYQAVLAGMNLPPNTVIDSFANEPSLNGDSFMTNEKYVRHELQMLRDLKNVGVTYAVGAFSTGTPHERMIETGVYDKLIKEAEYWSMHLYGLFPLEAGELYSYDVLDKTDENRQLIRDIYLNGKKWDEDYKGWLLGRPKHIEARAKVIGVPMPKIIITEGFVDLIDNAPAVIRSNWSNNFGIQMFNYDPRGVLSWFDYLKWLFPELTIEETLSMIMNHIRDNILYQDYIVGMTLFGYNRQWGYPHGSHKESGHNWEDGALDLFRRDYLKIVNSKEDDDVVLPNPDDTPNKSGYLWKSIGSSNIRQDPMVNSATLVFIDGEQLVLTDEKIEVIMINENFTISTSQYTWYQFMHKNGQIYYVAKIAGVEFQEIPEHTELPKYVVDLLGLTRIMTSTQLQETIELFEAFQDFVYEVNQEGIDSSDDDYLPNLFTRVAEMIDEIKGDDIDASLDLLNLIIVGLKESAVF